MDKQNNIKYHVCETCGKKFPKKSLLKTHVQTVHEKRKDFLCRQCGKSFGPQNPKTPEMCNEIFEIW